MYTTRDNQQNHQPGRFLTMDEAHSNKLLWEKSTDQRLRRLDTYTPHHLRMKSVQRIGFYFADVGERISDDLHVLVVFSHFSAFHDSDR